MSWPGPARGERKWRGVARPGLGPDIPISPPTTLMRRATREPRDCTTAAYRRLAMPTSLQGPGSGSESTSGGVKALRREAKLPLSLTESTVFKRSRGSWRFALAGQRTGRLELIRGLLCVKRLTNVINNRAVFFTYGSKRPLREARRYRLSFPDGGCDDHMPSSGIHPFSM